MPCLHSLWFRKIGFVSSLSRTGTKRRYAKPNAPNRIGLLLLYYDMARLNRLEDEYVAETGEIPPALKLPKGYT